MDRHLSQSCLRQVLKPPNLSLMENLHPPGPALCKAHGSKALEPSAKNTCATPHLQGLCTSEVPWAWLCWMQM